MIARRIVIVGAGPGGLCLGAKLREAGFEDFVILERADGVGGTWRRNAYPGAACDIPSHLYSFSFDQKADWSRAYAAQPEILEYLEGFATRHGLREHLHFGVTVRGASWDDRAARWEVRTDTRPHTGEVLVGAVGMFNERTWPDLPGLRSFRGVLVHSAEWDAGQNLTGQAVAVIGSGASAVQLVPTIAPAVDRLYVFQRQAQWILPKADRAFTDEERELFRADPSVVAQTRAEIFARVEGSLTFSDEHARREAERFGLENLSVVADPDVRRKLQPVGPFGCHRPLISNDYYATFNVPHVELVTEPIERVTPDAIVTVDGAPRPVDTIVCATGFATTKFLSVLDVCGRDDRSLRDTWAHGAFAYRGIAVPGYPNLFMLYGPNTNNGSILQMIESQSDYIVRKLQRMERDDLTAVDVRPEAAARYDEALQEALDRVEVWHAACHGYYRSASGRIVTQWPDTMSAYAARLAEPDDDAYDVRAS